MSKDNENTDTVFIDSVKNEIFRSLKYHLPDTMDDDFRLISSIRYDPKVLGQVSNFKNFEGETEQNTIPEALNFLFLHYHYTRLAFSLEYFETQISSTAPGQRVLFTFKDFVDCLLKSVSNHSADGPYRLRANLSLQGELTVEVFNTPPVSNILGGLAKNAPPIWDVYVNLTPFVTSPFTSFKTNKRQHYDEARKRSLPGKKPEEEVIVWNHKGTIMEGSITNVAFLDAEGSWVTPPLSSGCLCGVTRHWLLRNNILTEQPVDVQNLCLNQEVLLFNAIRGVMRGKIVNIPKITSLVRE